MKRTLTHKLSVTPEERPRFTALVSKCIPVIHFRVAVGLSGIFHKMKLIPTRGQLFPYAPTEVSLMQAVNEMNRILWAVFPSKSHSRIILAQFEWRMIYYWALEIRGQDRISNRRDGSEIAINLEANSDWLTLELCHCCHGFKKNLFLS